LKLCIKGIEGCDPFSSVSSLFFFFGVVYGEQNENTVVLNGMNEDGWVRKRGEEEEADDIMLFNHTTVYPFPRKFYDFMCKREREMRNGKMMMKQ
jgi:hypothetical protein